MNLPRWSLFLVLVLSFGSLSWKASAMALQAGEQPANTAAQKPGDANPKASPDQEAGDDVYRHSPSVTAIAGWLHLGKEPAAELFEYVNFAVLAGAVLYGLSKVLPKTLRENRETIQHQLLEARTATQTAKQQLQAIEKRLGHLGEEIEAIRKQAETDSVEEEARIKAAMEQERQRIVDAVGRDVAAASSAAQRELKRFAAGLAVDRARQTLSLTEDDDRTLLDEFSATLAQHTQGRGES